MTESSQNIDFTVPVKVPVKKEVPLKKEKKEEKEEPVKKEKKEKKVKPNIVLIEETEPVITQFEDVYKESETVIKLALAI